MANDDYVTHKEINHLEEKIDLKFENMDTKINNLPTQFENMMLKEREHQDNKRKETNRFIWGTIVIGIVGIALSVASFFYKVELICVVSE